MGALASAAWAASAIASSSDPLNLRSDGLVRTAQPCSAQEKRSISEEEVRRHRTPDNAWAIFNDTVYNITRFHLQHQECQSLRWVDRVAGRRLDHFLGRDAFGIRCIRYCERWPLPLEPTSKLSKIDVRSAVEQVLQPYQIGKLEPPPLSHAAQSWPDVDPVTLELSFERADGTCLSVSRLSELRSMYPPSERVVTHVCSKTGRTNTQRWVGVRILDLLPHADGLRLKGPDLDQNPTWDPLITFVGMDGFGYSIFRSRAEEDDVLLAYERDGVPLDTEQGGPLRLVKNGQHAKWVERLIIEGS